MTFRQLLCAIAAIGQAVFAMLIHDRTGAAVFTAAALIIFALSSGNRSE